MTSYSDPGGGGYYGALDTTTFRLTWLYGSVGYPSVNSINQGDLGDCWYLSALIDMATFDPSYIESMITADGGGYYTIKLYVAGAAQFVTIGDDLPSNTNSGNGYGNWASLIEKAYAALVGSYTVMISNSADTAFAALTGLSCTDVSISSRNEATIASQIEAALSAGKGVEIYSYDLFVPQAQPANNGLIGSFPTIDYNSSTGKCEGLVLQFTTGSHAYAVVGYDSTTGNLIVRNPWGKAGSTDYSNAGVTYPNAYKSTGNEATSSLTAPSGSSGTVMGGYNVDYFSEFEISISDLQYFYAGAITNSLLPTPPAPTVNVQNVSVAANASIAASSMITSISNPSGDSITQYAFWDGTSGNGYFTLNGVVEPSAQWFTVAASNLSSVRFVGAASAGSDTLDVEVYDATAGAWSAYSALTATTTAAHVAPTINVQNVSVAANASIAASSMVTSVSNPSGDSITQYVFYDTGSGGGYFTVNGTVQAANQNIYVNLSALGSIQYVGGPSAGSETLDVAAYDATTNTYTAFGALTATTTAAHVAPTINVQNVSVAANASIAASSMIASMSNPSGDSITQYAFWDATSGNGYFTLNGAVEPSAQWFTVAASNLSSVEFVGGASAGSDTLDVEVYDATTGAWSALSTLTAYTLATGNGNILDPHTFQLTASKASIYRLYGATLAREPDVAGLNYWEAALNSGESLAQITTGFINSTEFQTTYGSLNSTQFVTLLYNNVLNRAPDPTGLASWINVLGSGASRASVVDGFSESTEYQTNTAIAASAFATTIVNGSVYGSIFRLYGATLGRQPDAAGFVNWVDALAGGQSLSQITTGFINSTEFQATYGSLNNTQFVTLLYNNVLNRAPDTPGLTYWLNELNGGATRASVVGGFSESTEYKNNTASSLNTFMATTMAPTWGETLDGAGGTNTLLGGPGPDVFVFTQSDANGVNVNDTVYGLQTWDTLDLLGFGYANASDAIAHMTQSGNDVLFNAGLANGSNTLIDFHDTTLAAIGNVTFKFT